MKHHLQYEIPRRSHACCAGQEPFKPGMAYHTLLEESPEGELVRKDYCPQCWDKHKPVGGIQWKSAVPKPVKAPQTPVVRDERALQLLRGGECSPEEAFVLGLYLARRKKFALRHEEKERTIYEIVATEELVALPKIPLTHLAIAEIQARLLEKFKGHPDDSTSPPSP